MRESRCWLRLQSSESISGAQSSVPNVAEPHGFQDKTNYWRSFSSCKTLTGHQNTVPGFSQGEQSKRARLKLWCLLLPSIRCHPVTSTVLPEQSCLIAGRDYTSVWMSGMQDPWKPAWGLAITLSETDTQYLIYDKLQGTTFGWLIQHFHKSPFLVISTNHKPNGASDTSCL